MREINWQMHKTGHLDIIQKLYAVLLVSHLRNYTVYRRE